jgi:hypothetical protein
MRASVAAIGWGSGWVLGVVCDGSEGNIPRRYYAVVSRRKVWTRIDTVGQFSTNAGPVL